MPEDRLREQQCKRRHLKGAVLAVHIALFRGINVGSGNNKAPMADLRAMLDGLGFAGVRTYIQSGNAVFSSSDSDPEVVAGKIEAVFSPRFGFAAKTIIVSADEFRTAISCNPYVDETQDPTKVHLGFMAGIPGKTAIEALRHRPQGADRWAIAERRFYLHTPDGMGKSVVAPFIERTLNLPVTFRNWRTVLTLAEMAE
jgi:uncharacterized protein (DUF1697 family)